MALLFLMAVTSCGQSSIQVRTPAPGAFGGSIDLHGEIATHGTFVDDLTARGEGCKAYANGSVPATSLWVVPEPHGEDVGGHVVSFTAGVPQAPPSAGFHGPGTYTGSSAILGDLVIDAASFLPAASAQTTIIVHPDGSGLMSFSSLVDTVTDVAESGTVSWRCRE